MSSFLFKKDFPLFLKQTFLLSWDLKTVLIGWGPSKRYRDLPKNKSETNKIFFFLSDFFLKETKPWWFFEKCAFVPLSHFKLLLKKHIKNQRERKKEKLKSSLLLEKKEINTKSFLRLWTPASKNSFLKQVSSIQKLFDKGHLKKAVPLSLEKSNTALSDIEKCSFLLSALKKQKQDQILYAFWEEEKGLLGLSPELLFDWSQKDNQLRSMALGGTSKPLLSHASSIPLLENSKEIKEHQLVVQDLVQKFQNMGKIQKNKTYEWDLPPLRHLRTDFLVKLEPSLQNSFSFHLPFSSHKTSLFPNRALKQTQAQKNAEDSKSFFFALKKSKELKMIETLHPTPALGVAPQSFDWKWLKTLEENAGFERRYFGAPFGALFPSENHGFRFLCLVAIRNLQWFNGNTHLISGCGFLPESEWKKEWKELNWKRESVKNFLFSLDENL